jgi:hypothetical protein
MKKNIIFRNMERLIYSDAHSENEPIEPMSEWKWNKIYQLANEYKIGAWVADGIRCYEGHFFLNIPPELRQKFLSLPAEKDNENLAKFQLDIDRKMSLRRRFSSQSIRAYAADIMKVVSNIEE